MLSFPKHWVDRVAVLFIALSVATIGGVELVKYERRQNAHQRRLGLPAMLPEGQIALGSLNVGSRSAPIGMVELTEPDCEACRAFSQETVSRIYTDFIETGLVLYSLRLSPRSSRSGRASDTASFLVCASKQNVLWEAYQTVFRSPLSKPVDEIRRSFSTNIGDAQIFDECMAAQPGVGVVREDSKFGMTLNTHVRPEVYIGPLREGEISPYYRLQGPLDFGVASLILTNMRVALESDQGRELQR